MTQGVFDFESFFFKIFEILNSYNSFSQTFANMRPLSLKNRGSQKSIGIACPRAPACSIRKFTLKVQVLLSKFH